MRSLSGVSKEMKRAPGTLTVKRRIAPQLLVLLAILAFIAALWSYMLLNTVRHETLDQHVYRIASQLKCPVCQSESVADSTTSLAQEMRGVIRQKLQAGESDQQIIQEFIDSYGTQIVWSPPWWGFSALAWFVPIMLLLCGIGFVGMTLRSWRTALPVATTHGAKSTLSYKNGNDVHDDENVDEADLADYRAQLERELVEDDILFQHDNERQGAQTEQLEQEEAQ